MDRRDRKVQHTQCGVSKIYFGSNIYILYLSRWTTTVDYRYPKYSGVTRTHRIQKHLDVHQYDSATLHHVTPTQYVEQHSTLFLMTCAHNINFHSTSNHNIINHNINQGTNIKTSKKKVIETKSNHL